MNTKSPSIHSGLIFVCFLTTFSSAATFTVTNTTDTGPGSLRAAIQSANLNFNSNDPSRVEFNIPGGGVQTIVLAPGSPLISSRPMTIDGFTQPGSRPNARAEGIDAVPLIQIRGELRLFANDCEVRGLVINNSATTGLTIQGSGCVVEGCFIGTDPTGTVGLGNDLEGVRVTGFSGARPNRIGGSSPAARNLISGNQLAGITVQSTAVATLIQGNYIGTDATGRRAIGNGEFGIRIFGNENTNATITIGGVNSAEGNRVAHNDTGVWVATGSRCRILGNSINGNRSLGIDIGTSGSGTTTAPDGPTQNDGGDTDTGPNGLQNHPLITSASVAGGTTTIQGTLHSKSNAVYRVEFFANVQPDPQGFGEGQFFLGAREATTDGNGNASFTVNFLGAYLFISATATDAEGNTSEFSSVLFPPPAPFAPGDVFVSGPAEVVQRFGADGSLKSILRTDATGEATYGMAFDPQGNLYVTGRENSALTRFDSQGGLVGPFGGAPDGFSWFVRFDAVGNAYVASALGSFGLRKFNAQGALVQEFNLPRAGFIGATSFDLSQDGRTVFYALEGATLLGTVFYETRVRRYNLATGQPVADFATNLPGNVRGVELLLDGGMLVAIESELLRLNAQGQIIQRYDFFGEDSWSAVVRGAEDESFWAAPDLGAWIYRFDLATGEMVQRIFVGKIDEPSLLVKRGSPRGASPGTPATFTVTSTGNGGAGSFREAIEAANANPGRDTILFDIPGPGPHTILPGTPLSEITDPVIIDGYSQSGSLLNNASAAAMQVIQVVLDGSNAGPLADGLTIATSQCVVKGLAIVRFSGSGLVLLGAGNQVFGNYIGIDPAGNAAGNHKHGILVADSWLNQMGTGNPANFNVISANAGSGVAFEGASAGGNLVGRNFIGVGRTVENALGNGGAGVLVTQSENTIGSAGGLGGNVIAFNSGAGVEVYGSLELNRFRTWRFQEAFAVLIQLNSIHSNGGLGIDLMPSGLNLNDEGSTPDRDTGPNNRLNYPRLNPAIAGGQSVSGEWTSPANARVTIDIFANPECDSSGQGEGRTHLGRGEATTDANGRATFTVATRRPLIEGEFVTAVAIAEDNDTSEFSPCVRIARPVDLAITVAPSPSPVTARAELTYTITVQNIGPGAASNVRLTNAIPVRTDLVSNSTQCERDSRGNLICQWAAIAPGESVIATLVVRPRFVGTVKLAASAIAAELDPRPANNTATVETIVTGDERILAVTNTNDLGAGSLRAAIEQVNASGVGLDTITFNIPGQGVRIIKPASDVPRIEIPVVIDGYSQPGSRPNTRATGSDAVILIEIEGSPPQTTSSGAVLIGTGVPNGLQFIAPGCVVHGLSIHSCAQTGVRIETRDPLPRDPPTIIEGCFIGTDATGRNARGNSASGIDIGRGNARIGGLTPAARNLISGNGNVQTRTGLGITVGSAAAAVIQGNLIGTDATGMIPLGNLGAGIEVRFASTLQSVIGGRDAGAGNVIAFNGGLGVNAVGHMIVGNSIFANGALGIGNTPRPTANDAGDPLPVGFEPAVQNYPELSPITFDGATTTIPGALHSRTNESFIIDFYANSEPDNSFFGEGELYLGLRQATTDSAGNANFIASFLGQHRFITATATDASGRTSEFSPIAAASGGRLFAIGDLAISLDTGFVQWRRSDGTLVGLLDTGLHQDTVVQATASAAFDPQANLFVSGRHLLQSGNGNAPISRFSGLGGFAGVFGTLGTRPVGITFDANGNLFAASSETGSDVTKYDSTGQVLEKFDLPNERGTNSSGNAVDLAVQWLELSGDQRTLYYTSEAPFLGTPSKQIKRYDVVSKTALPDFASNLPGIDAQQFRLLPDGGGILANLDLLVRFDANGQRVRTYDADGEDEWSHVALAADGQSFWAAGRVSIGTAPILVYRIDLATGQVVARVTAGASVAIHALAVNTVPALLAEPRLTITLGNNGRVRINWPGDLSDFSLETAALLSPPADWSLVIPAPPVESGQFTLRLNPADAGRFYRLRKP